VTGRAEDKWLAVIGCISDHYLPDFAEEFGKEKPELWGSVKEPFDAYFNTEIGRIAQGFNFGLKDSTSNIVRFQNFLIGAKGPEDVFQEVKENYSFRKKYGDIKKRFDSLIKKAKEDVGDKLVFFSYGGDMSISSEVANKLMYDYPDKYIIVGYKKGDIVNLSLRGENVRDILDKILQMKEFEGYTGGGHENAVGSRIGQSLLERFREVFEKEINGK
jgi:oligoribonuclease NrnB/cAMP/cGMP phosphodiesterase (DHH superfamily)